MFGIASILGLSAIVFTFSFGGVNSSQLEEFPFKVVLKVLNIPHACGGVLLSSKHLLTSTNCLENNKPSYSTLFSLSTYLVTPFDATLNKDAMKKSWRQANEYEVSWEDDPKQSPHSDELNGDIRIVKLFLKINETATHKHAFLPSHDNFYPETARALAYDFEYDSVAGPEENQLNNFTIANFRISKNDNFTGTATIHRDEKLSADNQEDKICYGYDGDALINDANEVIGIMTDSWNCTSNIPRKFIFIGPYKNWIERTLTKILP